MVIWFSIVSKERGFVCNSRVVWVGVIVVFSRVFCCNGSWEDEGWGVVFGEIYLKLGVVIWDKD